MALKIRKYKNLFNISLFSRIPPWLYLLILGIITFFAHPILVPSDLKVYSCNALNIFLGKGYVDIDGSLVLFRPPLFPLMIALSYWFLGVSHESTFWVIKAFCVLNPVIVYAIGKRFFGKRIGISAALLVLTSYTINYWSFRHLDAIWPFFVLLSTFSFYLGFEGNKSRYFALAGISLALAYLVKEVAILFFPMPFLMFLLISDYRKKIFIPKVFLSFAVTSIVTLPWLFYLIHHNSASGVDLIIGGAGSGILKSIVNPSGQTETQNILLVILSNLKAFCLGIFHYYHGLRMSMDKWFTIAPLFIIAWCFVLFGAIRGNKHLRILVFHVILFVPIIYIQGARNMRLGQTLIFFLLSYLAIAVFIDSVLKVASQRFMTVNKISQKIFIVIIVCLIMMQVFVNFRNDSGYKEFIKKNLLYEMAFGDKNGAETYEYSTIADNKKFLNIIKQFSTPPNKLYMAITNRSLAKESYFNLKGSNTIHYLTSQIHKWRKGEKSSHPKEQPIYFTAIRRTGLRQHSFKAVYKSQIVKTIEKESITHILVESINRESGGNRGLERYFSTCRAFKRIPLPFDEVSVYKVISNTKISLSLPPIMDITSLKMFFAISSEKSEKNLMFLKRCFKIFYPSNPCVLQENESHDSVHISDKNSLEAPLLNKEGMNYLYNGDHEQAIESFKQAICINPDFVEAYTNLFFASALFERQKAISLNPENPVAYFHYAIFLNAHGFFDTALLNVQKAISLDPNYAEAYFMLGSLYAKEKKHYDAIDSFQKALTIYKGFFGPRKELKTYTNYVLVGDSFVQLGKFSKAKMSYEQAVSTNINPKLKPDAYYKLGVLCQRLNDNQAAIENLKQAVRLNPNFAEAYYRLSYSHLLLGDRKNALKQYKKLRKIDQDLAKKLNQESEWTLE